MTNRRQPYKQPRDPLSAPHGRGRVEYKDYTKFIQWTPSRIAIFTLCLVLPYVAAAIAVGLATSPSVAVLMLAIPVILGGLGAAFYWVVRKAL